MLGKKLVTIYIGTTPQGEGKLENPDGSRQSVSMENNHTEPMEPSDQCCPNLACCANGMRNEIAARKRSYVNRLRERIVISKATIVTPRAHAVCERVLYKREGSMPGSLPDPP